MNPVSTIVDIAAHFASGEAPFISFRQLAPAVRSAAPAPLFLLGHANAVVHEELYGQRDVAETGCYGLDDALVAPTGIAMKDGYAFTSPAFIHPPHHVATITERLRAQQDLPVRHVPGKLAVIYGPGHQTHGHWLVDFLPRLWVLAQAGHELSTLNFLVPRDLSEHSARLLEAVGIGARQLVRYAYWSEVIRADLLLMPTGLRAENRISPLFRQATSFWTKRLIANLGPLYAPYCAKIMLSRSNAPQDRELLNRGVIESIARERGYDIVHPETMSLVAQAGMFANASCIVGEYGSALHGSVFSSAGTVICGLRGNSRHPSFIQSGVAGALGQRAGYVLGATDGQTVAQRFMIEAADFERALDIMDLSLVQSRADLPALPKGAETRIHYGWTPGSPLAVAVPPQAAQAFWKKTPAALYARQLEGAGQ